MKQTIDKHGNLTINLFEICDQQDDAKFIYFYLGLDKSIKKIIENAFYTAYTKKLLDKEHPEIIHHEENGLTHIEVHPKDIVRNIEIIKRILLAGNSKVVVEDENE
jgi:hypothetical protein|tara:strand:+ start:611 stop:928 length:318 start_codon:yes stop_codon:yes gene_type:complete